MGRDYPRLGIVAFGEELLKSGDLDPIYLALSRVAWPDATLHRWLLAYWVFYHAGVASYLAQFEGLAYFDVMLRAGENSTAAPCDGRWPRGHERRHMRGANATKCISYLRSHYGDRPESFVDICAAGDMTCGGVMKRVGTHVGFGPWIGFKVADMLERVVGLAVSFERSEVFIFKDPKKAALLFWRLSQGLPEGAKPRDEARILEMVVHYLITEFADVRKRKAPPRDDRPVGLQEVETILCKWKSHLNGHYPLKNDITEINEGIQPWVAHSALAVQFYEAMPK